MTDWRNARIEEAANERYPDIKANPETFPTGWSREQERNAFIAGAVFEKALGEATVTPTDADEVISEREALIKRLEDEVEYRVRTAVALSKGGRDHEEQVRQGRASVRFLATGFRRTEVPEPSAPRGRPRGRHTDEQMLYMICLALEEGLEGVANIDLPDLIVKMISEHWGTVDADTSSEEAEAALAQLEPYIPDHMRTPETQVEPSDADLDAARAEIAARMNYKVEPTRDAMRAALRAANEVR